MNSFCKILLLFTCSLSAVTADIVLPPAPPADGIYDPGQWLAPEQRSEIEKNLAEISAKSEVGVYVVILDEKAGESPLSFARTIGKSWGKDQLWGVILHSTGEVESPVVAADYIEAGRWPDERRSEFQDSLKRILSSVRKEVSMTSDPQLRVMKGSGKLAVELSYLSNWNERQKRAIEEAASSKRSDDAKEIGAGKKYRWLYIAIPALFLLIAIFWPKGKRSPKSKRKGFYFPETSHRKRLRAPWSGGNRVLVDFGKKQTDPQIKKKRSSTRKRRR